jgi:rhodanese-related sulfurtransferase
MLKLLLLLPLAAYLMVPVSAAELRAQALQKLLAGPGPHPVLVDIRPNFQFKKGSLPGAINVEGRILLERKMKFSRGCILLSDGIADKVDVADLASKLAAKTGVQVDYLYGGVPAWFELSGVSGTAKKGATLGQSSTTLTYEDLKNRTGGVCFVDCRSEEEKAVPEGHKCPVKGFCDLRKFSYCPDMADFHRRQKGKTRAQRAGEGPLIVLITAKGTEAGKDLQRLYVQGYRRCSMLIGGAEVIKVDGRRGKMRGASRNIKVDEKTLQNIAGNKPPTTNSLPETPKK